MTLQYPPAPHNQGGIIRKGYDILTETLDEPIHELYCEADITPEFFVVFDVFPFAAGAQRLAFRGNIYERVPNEPAIYKVPAVVKFEMATQDLLHRSESGRTRICEMETEKTIRKHDIVGSYVKKWGELGMNKTVYLLATEKVRITKGCSLDDINHDKYPVLHDLFKILRLDSVLHQHAIGTVEDFLPGRFTKFLNNDGHINGRVSANFPEAFAHWTWVKSGGQLMISDIQGVRTSKGYILTDPAVHSVMDSEGFGLSDLGTKGVEEFFELHECNDLCRDLGLREGKKDLDLGHQLRTRVVKVKEEPVTTSTGNELKDPLTSARIASEIQKEDIEPTDEKGNKQIYEGSESQNRQPSRAMDTGKYFQEKDGMRGNDDEIMENPRRTSVPFGGHENASEGQEILQRASDIERKKFSAVKSRRKVRISNMLAAFRRQEQKSKVRK